MSHTYGGNPANYPTLITCPDGNDPRTVASLLTMIEALADRTAYLASLKHVQGSVQRWLTSASYDPATWSDNINVGLSGKGAWKQGATSGVVTFPLTIPHASTITAIRAKIEPATTHPGLPGGLPFWQLYEVDPINRTTTVLQLANDPSVSLGGYETPHEISATGLAITVDKQNKTYFVKFQGENGANFVIGSFLWGIRVTFTTSVLDEGAGG